MLASNENSNTTAFDLTRPSQSAFAASQDMNGENSNGPLSSQFKSNIDHLTSHIAQQQQLIEARNTNSNQRRLIIHKIILENFKSYQGKVTIGPFHKSFTAIVGPNGSGKSNLIESLLFIFGKRANWMRLKHLHELIHHSSRFPHQKKASVEVLFQEIIDKDDAWEYDVVKGSEFSIKRTVNQTGGSKYEINNRETTQADVVTVLKSKGIDLDNNRFLILQGEVEQISLMKPKNNDPNNPGLLEYLEDIIGSNRFKEKIENLESEYSRGNDVVLDRMERVRISQADLEKLDESKNVAVEYVKKERQCFQLQNIQLQAERNVSSREIADSEKAIGDLKAKAKEENKKKSDKIKENDSVLKEYKKIQKDLKECEKFVEEHKQKLQKIEQKDVALNEDIKFKLTNEIKHKERVEELEKQTRDIVHQTTENSKLLPEKERELLKLLEVKEKEEKHLADLVYNLRSQTEDLNRKKEKKERELDPHSRKYTELENQLHVFQNEYDLLNQKSSNINDEISQIEGRKEGITGKLNQQVDYLAKIDEALAQMSEIHRSRTSAITDLKMREDNIQKELQERYYRVEDNKQTTSESMRNNTILTELLAAQGRKELSGIYGRLGDLGAIDEMFDVAVTTSCPQLENIVVNKYEEAQKCVEFLRANRIGRATFIALDRVDWVKDKMRSPFYAPNNSQRLFDLIKVKNDIFKTAFYFALRDTLVCDDLDTATNIAYGHTRYRVVTVQGHLIDISGTMSGGGKQKRGGMSTKLRDEISPEEIGKLQDEIKSYHDELERVKSERQRLELQLQEVQRDEQQARYERQRQVTDIEHNKQELKEMESRVAELQRINKKRENEDSRKKQLEKNVEDVKAKMENVARTVMALEAEIRDLDNQIQEIGGSDVKSQRRRVNEINKHCEDLENEVNKMKIQLESFKKQLSRNKKEQGEEAKKLEVIQKQIEKLKREREDVENEALAVLGTLKAANERHVQLERENLKFQGENDRIQKLIQEIQDSIDRLEGEVEDRKRGMKKAKDEYQRASAEIEQNRKNYEEIIQQYDFLDELELIAGYKISSAINGEDGGDGHGNAMAVEGNNVSRLENSMLDETALNATTMEKRTKRVKTSGFSYQTFQNIEVHQDLSVDQLVQFERYLSDIRYQYQIESEKLATMKPNINSINEYKKRFLEHKERVKELEDIQNTINTAKGKIEELKKSRFDEFMTGFQIICAKLKETYQLLTRGGDAELELIDSLDPFNEGVVFSVRPPKKSWKQMTKLSGGEKTLSSLALVFALHYYKPTPLYFMDEIDAALDFKNVGIVGEYILKRTKNAQFIIISLRNQMFELADKLVGVYKTFDTTKTLAINPKKILELIENEEKDDASNNNDMTIVSNKSLITH